MILAITGLKSEWYVSSAERKRKDGFGGGGGGGGAGYAQGGCMQERAAGRVRMRGPGVLIACNTCG